jgi:hypothetical protein
LCKHVSMLLLIFVLFSMVMGYNSFSYADDENIPNDWDGRFSISSIIIDNDRIGDGQEITQTYLLRLIKEENLNEKLKFSFHILSGFILSTQNQTQSISAGELTPENLDYRCIDLNWDILNEPGSSMFASVDRLNFKLTLEDADITIGRQPVTFGEAWFWNPLDIFLPFNAQTIDRDYKSGVDAIRIDIPAGQSSGFNVVAAAGYKHEIPFLKTSDDGEMKCDWYGSALMANYFTNVNGWDCSIQGGKVYGGYQLGGGFVGEAGPYQLRGEAALFNAENSTFIPSLNVDTYEDHFDLALGIGRYYTNNLNIDFEYLYNGAGESDNPQLSLMRMQSGRSRHLSKNLAGLRIEYQLHPLRTGQIMCIYSIDDASFSIQPVLNCSVSDNSDLILGATLNFGKSPVYLVEGPVVRSEFGSYPGIIYAEIRHFF